MSQHPPSPTTLEGLVDAFEQTAYAVLHLAQSLSPEQAGRHTECPGWTVHDQVSHVSALESLFAGDPQPRVDLPELAHVRSDFARFMEMGVHARRQWPTERVVAELADVLPRRLAALRDPSLALDSVIESAIGSRSAGSFVSLRVNDIWCHEQDIRAALDLPLALDTAGAAIFTDRVLASLPVIARAAELPGGTTVVLEVTGPASGMAAVRIEPGPEGLTQIVVPLDEVPASATRVTMVTEAFTRRGAGRRTTEQTPYAVSGDIEVARRLVDHLAVTP